MGLPDRGPDSGGWQGRTLNTLAKEGISPLRREPCSLSVCVIIWKMCTKLVSQKTKPG